MNGINRQRASEQAIERARAITRGSPCGRPCPLPPEAGEGGADAKRTAEGEGQMPPASCRRSITFALIAAATLRPTPIVEKHYQLTLWMLPKIANFPKDQRFLLADRIERVLLDILELLIEAVYSKERRDILVRANLKLDVLRFMMRLAFDMKYVNLKQYDTFCQGTLEIGRMAGGWMKAEVWK